ncbi:MAG: magnesium/cobalt transporter CorA [Devosia nanyangense]|uniref:Magnesium transport protein CorA n=1 Tax=Devosia nanyangense TaxID=1228055 RepID=A0A933NV15_9HYPH|nr:magnesium/cobalt transporter CorA [Devosia nanyangense]
MLRAYIRENDRLVATDIDIAAGETPLGAAVWYNLTDPTRAEDDFVESCLGIDIPTRAEMDDIEPSARLYNEDGAEFMTITALFNADSDEPMKTPITFVLRNNQLVTVRYADPRPFKLFERLVTRPTNNVYTSGEKVMLGLIEAIIDRLAQLLETTGDEIDLISREVFRNKTKNVTRKARDLQEIIERIGKKGDILTLARESLVSITRLSSFHQTMESGNTKSAKDLRQELKILQRDAAALSDHAAFLSNKINFLLDATLGLINLEQNQIIKIFSVAAVVFLPPTLVASVYGMNFDLLPELHLSFGYPLALGLMVCSAILPYLFFKRKGWL